MSAVPLHHRAYYCFFINACIYFKFIIDADTQLVFPICLNKLYPGKQVTLPGIFLFSHDSVITINVGLYLLTDCPFFDFTYDWLGIFQEVTSIALVVLFFFLA